MGALKESNGFGEFLESSMLLRTSPIAVKMLQNKWYI